MLIWSISYPVCLPSRWKWEEINIGLSHHLLVHHSKVLHPAEDFDYFPLLWQTRSSLRSLSLFSTFFLFPLSFLSAFSLLLPLLFGLLHSHLEVFDSPGLAYCDLFPSRIDPAPHPTLRHMLIIYHSQSRSEVIGSWPCSPLCGCVLVGTIVVMDLLIRYVLVFFLFQNTQTHLLYMHDFMNHPIKRCWHNFFSILK